MIKHFLCKCLKKCLMLKALQSVLVLMLEGPTEVLDPMPVSVHPTYHITPFLKPDSHYMYM